LNSDLNTLTRPVAVLGIGPAGLTKACMKKLLSMKDEKYSVTPIEWRAASADDVSEFKILKVREGFAHARWEKQNGADCSVGFRASRYVYRGEKCA
jgi:hypothetical protein